MLVEVYCFLVISQWQRAKQVLSRLGCQALKLLVDQILRKYFSFKFLFKH